MDIPGGEGYLPYHYDKTAGLPTGSGTFYACVAFLSLLSIIIIPYSVINTKPPVLLGVNCTNTVVSIW